MMYRFWQGDTVFLSLDDLNRPWESMVWRVAKAWKWSLKTGKWEQPSGHLSLCFSTSPANHRCRPKTDAIWHGQLSDWYDGPCMWKNIEPHGILRFGPKGVAGHKIIRSTDFADLLLSTEDSKLKNGQKRSFTSHFIYCFVYNQSNHSNCISFPLI